MSNFYNFINPKPFRQYWEHEYDVVDISWQTKRDNRDKIIKSKLVATCGLDLKVILWNIEKETPEMIFELKDAPVCISFHPELENIFVTGSLDQIIRRWSID